MRQPVDHRTGTERQDRDAILRSLGEQACTLPESSDRSPSVPAGWRRPFEFAFAAVFGVLCGLISVLLVVALKVILG